MTLHRHMHALLAVDVSDAYAFDSYVLAHISLEIPFLFIPCSVSIYIVTYKEINICICMHQSL
jgi:hypothetical protein